MRIAELADADVAATVALWRRCELTRPWNDPEADIALARRSDNAAVLLGFEDDAVVASVLVGHDGHRGWVYYVAVDPDAQGEGHGRAIMDAAEAWLRERGIAKLMLMVREENAQVRSFYEALGYGTQRRAVYAKWLDGRAMTP